MIDFDLTGLNSCLISHAQRLERSMPRLRTIGSEVSTSF